jgi:hypothetical protein
MSPQNVNVLGWWFARLREKRGLVLGGSRLVHVDLVQVDGFRRREDAWIDEF